MDLGEAQAIAPRIVQRGDQGDLHRWLHLQGQLTLDVIKLLLSTKAKNN